MIIDIKDNRVTLHKISNFETMNEFFKSGEKLKIFESSYRNSYTVAAWIAKELKIDGNNVYIKRFWTKCFCEIGGVNKKEFINFQVLAYELKELNDALRFLSIYVRGKLFKPNWQSAETRDGRDTKQMIKFYKRTYPTSRVGCRYFKIPTEDQHTKLCCVCGDKNILLLKGVISYD